MVEVKIIGKDIFETIKELEEGPKMPGWAEWRAVEANGKDKRRSQNRAKSLF
ncbi:MULTISPECIES: hypothetical protein [Metallosphaera]|uniref:hypothetical protein n=1 Tax=Metallosphaera TaxID=41980 RepID=UPI000A7D03E8|nr:MULTISPECIES: hypothetical protein [Metallosphaera]MCH1771847.1 CENP-N/CHL4 family protein [Metallosphaera sedula]MCP6729176.1 CENP-N/CHL4 family protein [Metallosphaera sedula]MCY0862520.1 hypothetical protein [Metallosphaera prunae]WPX06295.1 hypothetical protein SOJ17_002389 [Metallosphaera sedula DSM 5348]BBL46074.1 hypothetical protein MJ1HA_0165 [Metallosphaera sedula]